MSLTFDIHESLSAVRDIHKNIVPCLIWINFYEYIKTIVHKFTIIVMRVTCIVIAYGTFLVIFGLFYFCAAACVFAMCWTCRLELCFVVADLL